MEFVFIMCFIYDRVEVIFLDWKFYNNRDFRISKFARFWDIGDVFFDFRCLFICYCGDWYGIYLGNFRFYY